MKKNAHSQEVSEPTVFISSTFTDLSAEREAVVQAAEKAGLRVIRFEEFAASFGTVQQTLSDSLRGADLVVLIVAFRYGFVASGSSKSLTEMEFDLAKELRKPIFVFMLSSEAPWPVSQIPTGEELTRIEDFRQRLAQGRVVSLFRNAEELRERALAGFLRWKGETALPFVEGDESGTEEVAFGPMLLQIRSQLALLVQRSLSEPRPPLDMPTPEIRPAEFLGRAASTVEPDRVFVIMPYSTDWSDAVERVLRDACESVGAKFDIAKSRDGRFIIQDIWQGITGSAITIADLTGGNANVAYEVGLADALGRVVILVSQESDVPVDFRGARLILYRNTIEGALALRETVTDRLRKLLPASSSSTGHRLRGASVPE